MSASKGAVVVGGLVLLALLVAPALAHVPAWGTDNDSPETATVVTDPTKSWAFYDRVDAGGGAYYEATYREGERLYLTLYTPDPDLQPGLVVMTPGGKTSGSVPEAVEVPDGYGATVRTGEPPETAEFEPFTPGAYYYTVSVDRTVKTGGISMFAVYDTNGNSGPVGVAVGRSESFTLTEFLTVPIDVLGVHAWEGDSPLLVFGPGLVVGLGGIVLLRRPLDGRDRPMTRWVLGLSAITAVGSAAMLATQLAVALATSGPTPAALLTGLLVAVPTILAAWVGQVATAPTLRLTGRRRLGLALVAVGWYGTWAGLLVAPLGPLLVALLPDRWLR